MLRFGARFGLAVLVGVGLWLLVHEPFAAGFRVLGDLVVLVLGGSRSVSFVRPQEAALFSEDASIVYTVGGNVVLTLGMASFRFGYTPLVMLCSLAFAARQWRFPQLRRLLLGFAVMVAYIALGIGIVVLHFGFAITPMPFPSLAVLERVADLGHTILGLPGFQYAVPAIIWYACTATAKQGLAKESRASSFSDDRSGPAR